MLPQLGTAGAIAVAELAEDPRRGPARDRLATSPPGARLHVLAIGVSDYGAAARHLDLAYADHDARDLAAALRSSQSSLYAARAGQRARSNADATRPAIFASWRAIARGDGARARRRPRGGALLRPRRDGRRRQFYLLPHDVDASSPGGARSDGAAGRPSSTTRSPPSPSTAG